MRTDEDMTAEHFARQTCLDCDMPVAFEEKISSSIHWHVSRARAIAKCPEAHNKTIAIHVSSFFITSLSLLCYVCVDEVALFVCLWGTVGHMLQWTDFEG